MQDSIDVLTHGELTVEGRLVDASNTTLRCTVELGDRTIRCVYKPVAGERPLWDFPDGTLAGREVAAYLVAAAMQWPLVPPTVRREGPLGVGACQLWIEESDEALVGFVPEGELPTGWHPVAAARDGEGNPYILAHAEDARLAQMAIFDVVVNNADRKGGHVLVGSDGRLYGVDHGVCLHREPKLRTVLWGWVGQPLPPEAEPALARLAARLDGGLADELADLLTDAEVAALVARVEQLRAEGRFPQPNPASPTMPWPPI
ncbi:SCO1664 family protein [Natronosporangium hydrolyticum]|uniref:SCO1664 family protein n=1 Tax=Natronosporangium hydrolyticum TaxID=2811111 RepID=A0A895YT77_9ACTN|nr:SCO1664 family protein [Natronosporangium hydrolyticum]QSB17310.1 SCO1664 family protein [Natronosporangium hydrolyticum]